MSFDGFALAKLVRSGAMSAASAVEASLSRIASDDPTLTCFTAVLADRARQRAEDLDVQLAAGVDIGPLAGVPFAARTSMTWRVWRRLPGRKFMPTILPPPAMRRRSRHLKMPGPFSSVRRIWTSSPMAS